MSPIDRSPIAIRAVVAAASVAAVLLGAAAVTRAETSVEAYLAGTSAVESTHPVRGAN